MTFALSELLTRTYSCIARAQRWSVCYHGLRRVPVLFCAAFATLVPRELFDGIYDQPEAGLRVPERRVQDQIVVAAAVARV